MNSNRQFNPQDAIIHRLEEAGHDVNDDGICAGATMVAIESALKDGHLNDFDILIQSLCDTSDLTEKIDTLKAKRAQLASNKIKCNLSTEESRMLEAYALLERIQIYQSPDQYFSLFAKTVSQHEPQIIAPLIGTHQPHSIQSQAEWTWSNIYDTKQLEMLLSTIQAKFTDKQTIGFAIANTNHKIALIHTNNRWILADINSSPSRMYHHDQLDKLTRKLQHIFREHKSVNCILSFNAFSTNAHLEETHKFLSEILVTPLCTVNNIANYQTATLASLAQMAITNHQTQLLEQILNAGLSSTTMVDGHSLVYLAASYGYTDMLTLLIAKNADVNLATSANVTPLFIATQRQHAEAVAILLKSNADTNIKRIDGVTALAMAVNKNNRILVGMLAKHDADLTARTPFGTPLEIATALGNIELQHLLKLLIVSKIKSPQNSRNQLSLFAKTNHKPAQPAPQPAAHRCM